jgi:HD-GYP domain-containing protein (c-di-GMP phosphodiesterase class II)
LRLSAQDVVLAAAAVPVAALVAAGQRKLELAPEVHFWFLVCASAIAATCAFALSAAGARRDDGRVVLVGTAFAAMATLLFVHGFATPGVVAPVNGVIAIAGAAILPVGGAVLALGTLPMLRRPRAVGRLVAFQIALVAAIFLFGAVGLLWPDLLPGVPEAGSPGAIAALVVGAVMFTPVVLRSAKTYALTRRTADLLVVIGSTWLMIALLPQLLVSPGHLAWWIGHVLELSGIAMAAAPVALDVFRAQASRPLIGDLRAAELVAGEEAFLGSRVRALMVRLDAKDPSTEEHTRRVARLGVEVGEELGLAPERLRELAIGGLLHDMGKLAVPDAILKKPAALTDEEFAEIRRHPAAGHDLLVELGGFSPQVLRLVRDHHERLDGSGYPGGITADAMDLETRILAVCDVYDALVSDRVYRRAWSSERALELLREEAARGLHDLDCVEALARVTAAPGPPVLALPATSSANAVRSRVGLRPVLTALAVTAALAAGLAAAAHVGTRSASPTATSPHDHHAEDEAYEHVEDPAGTDGAAVAPSGRQY